MRTLVLGASGKTGRLVVNRLLEKNISVRAVVRSAERFYALLPDHLLNDHRLIVIEANISSLSVSQLSEMITSCDSVISCLGHNVSFKGIFGKPRRLVTDAVRQVCQAINRAEPKGEPIKFILMNSTGNRNRLTEEKVTRAQQMVVWLIRQLIPPHADNEEAAGHLCTHELNNREHNSHISQEIEWTIIRPDTLTDEVNETNYDIYPAPTRSAIFNAGTTSRINVAHFMVELIQDSNLWKQWKNQMPVIYNEENQ